MLSLWGATAFRAWEIEKMSPGVMNTSKGQDVESHPKVVSLEEVLSRQDG